MADTVASHITSERICHNESEVKGPVTAYLVADTYPGQWVFYTVATRDWIKAASTTAAHRLARLGIVGYKKRVRQSLTNYVGTKVTIDAIWDISEAEDMKAPIHLNGFCTAFIVDQNAARGVMTILIISSTAGSCTILSQEETGAGPTTGTAFKSAEIGTLARDVADDDTVCIAAIGSEFGNVLGDI